MCYSFHSVMAALRWQIRRIMRKLTLVFIFVTSLFAGSDVEQRVLRTVRLMLQEEGHITFSSLYNGDRFSGDEKAFLGRLYEIFFTIPDFLKSEYSRTGKVPLRAEIAEHFDVSSQSVELLLSVMEADKRMPALYQRDDQTREIISLDLDRIEDFVRSKGTSVKMTNWEGKILPSFRLKTLDDQILTDKDLRGYNTLLYFWFTGCPPCVRITPILAELAEKYTDAGFRFAGFNADDLLELDISNESRKLYLKKQGVRFSNVNVDSTARLAFGNINVYPTLFFVRKDGTIFRHLVNFQSCETLVEIIEDMLK